MARKKLEKSNTVATFSLQDMADEVAKFKKIATDMNKAIQEEVRKNPNIVNQDLVKGWQQLPSGDAMRSPKSWQFDPLTLQYSLGYKERRFSLTYDIIKKTIHQLALLNAIVNTRCSQVAAFAQPYRFTKSLGFVIKHKDPDHPTTAAELAFIKELEKFIMACGREEKNPYSTWERDDFETFLRKITRDSLSFDQMTAEIIPDNYNLPFEFIAVDASSIRIAADNRMPLNQNFWEREGFTPTVPGRFQGMFNQFNTGAGTKAGLSGDVKYVQVLNGAIENVYTAEELAFGVRNPRTDLQTMGYGLSEVEQLISAITAYLYAEQFNIRYFSQGTMAKGIINMKGEAYNPDILESFKREWIAMVSGIGNAHSVPVMQSEGLEYIDLLRTNNEMQFSAWLDHLTKLICSVFMIDPSEIGFDLNGPAQQPLFESADEWKIKASRDKGLKPLLKAIAKFINKNIIDRIDDHFYLEFAGLDELSEQEKHEMLLSQIGSYMTLNEARRSLDLPDLPYGDVPLNPIYVQLVQAKEQQQMANQQQQMMGDMGGMPGQMPTGENLPEEQVTEEPQPPPSTENDNKPQFFGAFKQ